ncbi:hypothetical protein ACQE32_10075 [Pantoea sp. FN0302]|uniref:hypothetical protein n=1 Tax=unclassified Pantoea TaxID=2630326 RepID=UPI003CE91740
MYKKWIALLLLGVAGVMTWRYLTYVDPDDQDYYSGILCGVVGKQNDNYAASMRNIIEGSNNEYALQRIRFNHIAADRAINAWETVPDAEKIKLAQDTNACQHALATLVVNP